MSCTYFLTICVIIFQHMGRIFIRYYAFSRKVRCIYIYEKCFLIHWPVVVAINISLLIFGSKIQMEMIEFTPFDRK